MTFNLATILFGLGLAVPGGCGGVVSFLLALRNGHYRNNRYTAKLGIEIFGAMITATALAAIVSTFLKSPVGIGTVAFLVGLTWAKLIQILRNKITKIVEAALS